MRTQEVNADRLTVVKNEEVVHPKRGKERKITFSIEGVDEDGDRFIYKKSASAPIEINLPVRTELPPCTLVLKVYGIDGEKYLRVVKVLARDSKSDKKLS